MELTLQSPLHTLHGVGEARAAAFARLGLCDIRDLLPFFPRAYENRGDVRAVAETQDGQLCSLVLQIDAKAPEGRTRTGLTVTKLSASDNTGAINLTFFNQPWLTKSLRQGMHYRFYGGVVFGMYGREMTNPVAEALPARRTSARHSSGLSADEGFAPERLWRIVWPAAPCRWPTHCPSFCLSRCAKNTALLPVAAAGAGTAFSAVARGA